MSVYITGDCHGDFSKLRKFKNGLKYSPEKDYVIILGDFGGVWESDKTEEAPKDRIVLNALAKLPVTILIVGGNHENYAAIESSYLYSMGYFNGAKCRFIRHNVLWIERGEIFELYNRTFWCFAGAYSLDKAWRTAGLSWWSREEASEEEKNYGLKTLKKKPDYILTHDCPNSISNRLYPQSTLQTDTGSYLERCRWSLDAMQHRVDWYFGHYHMNWEWVDPLGNTYTCLYGKIEKLL